MSVCPLICPSICLSIYLAGGALGLASLRRRKSGLAGWVDRHTEIQNIPILQDIQTYRDTKYSHSTGLRTFRSRFPPRKQKVERGKGTVDDFMPLGEWLSLRLDWLNLRFS